MIRVVIDTNVYVSALVFGGKPSRLLQLVEALGIQIVVSLEIREEVIETLVDKFRWPQDRIETAFERIWKHAHWSSPRELIGVVRDPKDNHLIAAALDAQADYLITGDKDLLVLEFFGNLKIMSPADFLARQ